MHERRRERMREGKDKEEGGGGAGQRAETTRIISPVWLLPPVSVISKAKAIVELRTCIAFETRSNQHPEVYKGKLVHCL